MALLPILSYNYIKELELLKKRENKLKPTAPVTARTEGQAEKQHQEGGEEEQMTLELTTGTIRRTRALKTRSRAVKAMASRNL